MTRIYLSGPMTGLPDLNFPAFNAAAARLRALGYLVANPAEINPDKSADWHECLRADIKALCDCDAIALLDGWETSPGAHLELHIAHRLGLGVFIARELGAARSFAGDNAEPDTACNPECIPALRQALPEQEIEKMQGEKK